MLLIIRFTTLNKTYFLKASDLLDYMDTEKKKSIPLDYINKNGYLIKEKLFKIVDYLEIIDKLWRLS